MRLDIEQELRSLIMDALDARCPGGNYTLSDVTAVLQSLGPPREMAARYAPSPRYLIGPQLFDTYILVSSILLTVVTIGITISLGFELALSTVSLPAAVATLLSRVLAGAVGVFGYITIVFAVVERVLPDEDKKSLTSTDTWNPASLPRISRADEVKIPGIAAGICGTIIAIVIFNLFLNDIGLYYTTDSGWQFIPFLNYDALLSVRPFLNIIWGISLVNYFYLASARKWTVHSRLISIGLAIGTIIILGILASASLVDRDAFLLLGQGIEPETQLLLGTMAATAIRGALIIAIIGTTIDTVSHGIKLYAAGRLSK